MIEKIIPELQGTNTTLVAVSKTKPIALLQEVYDKGQRIFGENRVQELVEKNAQLPKDIEWHMIGHLQSKKVKLIAPFISLIHSVDSIKLLREINIQAQKNNRIIPILLQFKIAEEDSKYGFEFADLKDFFESGEYLSFKHIRYRGVMGMATFTADQDQVRTEFALLRYIFTKIKTNFFSNRPFFKEISMGMSGDYLVAIEEGSTMVRIGSLIFGNR